MCFNWIMSEARNDLGKFDLPDKDSRENMKEYLKNPKKFHPKPDSYTETGGTIEAPPHKPLDQEAVEASDDGLKKARAALNKAQQGDKK